jgi:hypothetical protein
LPGWTVAPNKSTPGYLDCCTVTLTHGKYVLAINPVFLHASGVGGGRVVEILNNQPSVVAVFGNEDWVNSGGGRCTQWHDVTVTPRIWLRSIYVDPSKMTQDCELQPPPQPVWFASYASGDGPYCDYSVTLTYNSTHRNTLPRWGSPELNSVLRDVERMLRTLRFKPPMVISKIVPAAAPPGATVTVYGRGFNLFHQPAEVYLENLPNSSNVTGHVAADGKSLTFQVPFSLDSLRCAPGSTAVNGCCVPANQVDRDAPPPADPATADYCGTSTPPGQYQILVDAGQITSTIPFTVTARHP